jgi:hypothetical protein
LAACAGLAAATSFVTLGRYHSLLQGRAAAQRGFTAVSRHRLALRAEDFDPFGLKQGIKGALGLAEEGPPPTAQEEQMVKDVFKKFDMDEDGRLNLEEFNNLQKATEGDSAVYNQEQMEELLKAVDSKIADPGKGFRQLDVRNLYLDPEKIRAYRTDLQKDHITIFGPGASLSLADEEVQENPVKAPGPAAGVKVQLKDLSGAKELNGRKGTIREHVKSEAKLVAEGRVIVELDDGERIALKPANVEELS